MYEQVFNFNARPFTSTPYVNHYFGASAMNQAFGQAAICIQRGSGPVVAIGDVGTGKSLLLAKLAAEHQAVFQVVDIDCSRVNSRKDLLQNILFQLGKPFNMDGETELRFAVIECANPTEASPNGLLLLVDDAETLTADIFEELRLLTNIVVDGSPQVRLVLAGRKSLEERLADPALASFSQRIASRVFLSNLSRDETYSYVIEHINRVGGNGQGMFPVETIAKLHELTDGCPRLVNQVCDFVLILASTRGATTVSANLIQEAWNDVQSLPMGSGINVATNSSSTTKSAETDWTVIEFGQLEDDSPEPIGTTVYDFQNSPAPEPAAITQHEVAPEPQTDLVSAAVASTSGIDPELGIDLGSLQAMQNAADNQVATEPSSDAPAEPTAHTTEPAAETETSQTENDARVAMEQQLADVFGKSPNTDTQEPVDRVVTEPDQPTESNSIANILSASAAVAGVAGISQVMKPETPDSIDTFQPATSALDDPTTEQPASEAPQSFAPSIPELPSVSESASMPEPSAGFTPVFSVDQFKPATQPIEEDVQSPVAETSSDLVAAAPPEKDPFEESFAVESNIPDSVANETISQNRKALKLTSADFSQLTPLQDPSPDSIVQQTEPEGESPETTSPSGTSAESSIAAQTQPAPVAEVESSSEISEPAPIDAEATGNQLETSAQLGFSILPMGTSQPFEPVATQQPVPQVNPPEPTTNMPVPAEPQAFSETPDSTESADELRKAHNDQLVSEEISRKADEILARLQNKTNLARDTTTTQEEQILSKIQQQQREVTESQLLGESEQRAFSIPALNPHQDDSEMLIVNPATDSAEKKPTSDTYPMTDSPISSGRATRLDYEQLFDRLRNHPEENQQ